MQVIKIGKSRSNDIYKGLRNDPTVSRFHCQIFIDSEGHKFLTDLDSTNGTFVNGNKISSSVKLDNLDIVRAGNSLVKWKEHLMGTSNKEPGSLNDKPNFVLVKSPYFWIVIGTLLFFFTLGLLSSVLNNDGAEDVSNYFNNIFRNNFN